MEPRPGLFPRCTDAMDIGTSRPADPAAQLMDGGARAHPFVFHLKRVERTVGIEPTHEAWKATALPLSYARFHVLQVVNEHLPTGMSRYGSEARWPPG